MFGPRFVSDEIRPDSPELDRADLSPWFNAFLPHFAREAYRCGGELRVRREDGAIVALLVTDPVEKVASIFTRSRELAKEAVDARGPFGIYSDFSFEPPGEVFDLLRTGREDDLPAHRFRHPLRPFEPADRMRVVDALREVYGTVNERWFDGLPTVSEVGFLAEVEGHLAGLAWVSRVRDCARLHSLTVRPPYRRIGLGTDLLFARLLWARKLEVSEVLSEIAHRNAASLAIAARGGLRPVGQIFYYPPEGGPP